MKNIVKKTLCYILLTSLLFADSSIQSFAYEISDVSGNDIKDRSKSEGTDVFFEKETTVSDGEMFNAETYDEQTYTLIYNIENGEATITGYNGICSGELSIPEYIDGYPVVSIGKYAFEGCIGLTGNLIIPEGVKSIGDYAFFGCGFTGDLIIPDSVTTIGVCAFCDCDFNGNLTIGSGVTEIGNGAFSDCDFSGALIIPNNVIKIGDDAFQHCGFTGSLTIGNGVTEIGGWAFWNCKFTGSLVIPDNVTSIGWCAFEGCDGFTGDFVIPETVTSVHSSAFRECYGFQSIENRSNCTIELSINKSKGFFWNNETTGEKEITQISKGEKAIKQEYNRYSVSETLDIYYEITSIDTISIIGCKGSLGDKEDLILPSEIEGKTVTKIDQDVFLNRSDFTGRLILPEKVTCIGFQAFRGCSGLVGELIIPNSVTKIEFFAFYGCAGFTGRLVIPNSITWLEGSEFEECFGINEIINDSSFKLYGLPKTKECYWINESTGEVLDNELNSGEVAIKQYYNIYEYSDTLSLFYKVNGNDEVTISGFDGYLAEGEDFIVPSEINGYTVVAIGESASYYVEEDFCTGRLVLPEGLITIGNDAFSGCSFTGDLSIPDSVKTIGDYAFSARWWHFDGELTIGKGVISIGEGAFHYCGFTGDVIIPENVLSIGENAFLECDNIDRIINESTCNDIDLPLVSVGEFWRNETTGEVGVSKVSAGETVIRKRDEQKRYKYSDSLTIYYADIDENSVVIVGHSGELEENEDLVIPSEINGKSVTEIGYSAFYEMVSDGYSFGSLVIPDEVTVIGDNAFEYCEFSGDLTIPESVTTIGEYAFLGCGFTGDLIIPDSVTTIGDYAFSSSGFSGNLVLGNSLTTIGERAFESCGFIGDLTIPDNVTTLGERAFSWCNGFSGTLSIGDGIKRISNNAFWMCTGFTGNLEIPNSVMEIGDSAFYCCSGFKGDLIIPSSVTSIGEGAFNFCDGIGRIINESSIDLPLVVSGLNCYWIDELTKETKSQINARETVIRCVNSREYKYSDSFTLIYSKNMADNSAVITGYTGYLEENADLVIPSKIDGCSVEGIGNYAFNECSGFTGRLVIPDSVKTIGICAFSDCSGFKGDLIIPDGVETIGRYAFSGCSGFNGRLSLSSQITEISNGAFWRCSGLSGELIIPDSVQRIGEGAFCRCEGLTGDLIIPNSVTSLGQAAFENCCGFTGNLILSDNITVISLGAFNNCTGFSGYLHIPDNVILVDDNAFNNCWGFTGNLEIPDNVISIGKRAFFNCKGFDGNLVMSDSVTSIGEAAFEECRGLTGSLFLPDSLTSIGTAAFFWCVGLTGTVVIPESVTSMGNSVFENCTGFDKFVNNSILDNIALPHLLYGDCWINVTTGEERVTVISAKQTVERKNAEPDSIQYYMQDSFTYSGSAIKPEIEVYDKDIRLVEKIDYTVSYKNNTGIYVLEEGKDYDTKKAPRVTITLKGNYSGKQTLYFTIMPKDISENDVVVADIAPVIAGSKAVKPTPAVTYGQKKLTNKKDYTIKYYSDPECKTDVVPKEAGTYYSKFTGKGNYTGEKVKSFTISPSDQKLVSKLTIGKIKNQPYTGSSITPALTVKDGKTPLSEGTDYTVTYQNNVEVGTATVTIIGDGEKYIGSRNITFKITGVAVSKLKVSGLSSAVYDGTEKKQSVENVVLKNANGPVKWIEKSEYDLIDDEQTKRSFAVTVTYTKNVNAGTAMMVFTGVNMYTGTLKKTFKITAYDIKADADNAVSVTLDKAEYEYSKAGVKPETTITFGDTTLVKGKDYTVSYSNNTVLSGNPKKIPAVKIKGKGNFKGSLTKEFVIGRKSFESSEIKISVSDKSYSRTGGNWKASVSVTDNGKKLSAGKEYEKNIVYTYDTIPEGGKIYDGTYKEATPEITRNPGDVVGAKDIVPAGTVIRATVTAKGNYYSDSKSTTYRVVTQDINKLTISVKAKEYTGREVTLEKEDITFKKNKYGDVTFEFVEGTYTNNIKKGKATVVIEGTGNYGGRKTITFNIGVRKILWWLR